MTTRVAFRVALALHFFAAGMFHEARYVLPRKWKYRILTPIEMMIRDSIDEALRDLFVVGAMRDNYTRVIAQGAVRGDTINIRLPLYLRPKP